jgi:amino acid/amide ABC transporter ATP-binding protein 1, HAAT family (TC 3.A.1.4.-)
MNAPATLLSVRNLTMRFGGLTAIDNLSLEVPAGKITGIIGPNGAGKTTLFNCLTGFYKPTTGTLRLATRAAARCAWRPCPATASRATPRWCAPSRTSACSRR